MEGGDREGEGRGVGEEKKGGARGAAQQAGVKKAFGEPLIEAAGGLRKLPKDRRKVRKGGEAAVKTNHEGAHGKFWAIREESHRGRERAAA